MEQRYLERRRFPRNRNGVSVNWTDTGLGGGRGRSFFGSQGAFLPKVSSNACISAVAPPAVQGIPNAFLMPRSLSRSASVSAFRTRPATCAIRGRISSNRPFGSAASFRHPGGSCSPGLRTIRSGDVTIGPFCVFGTPLAARYCRDWSGEPLGLKRLFVLYMDRHPAKATDIYRNELAGGMIASVGGISEASCAGGGGEGLGAAASAALSPIDIRQGLAGSVRGIHSGGNGTMERGVRP